MRIFAFLGAVLSVLGGFVMDADAQKPTPAWPKGLPKYDHIVIVVEENKDYDLIIGPKAASSAPSINQVLKKEGASFTQMFGQEHSSQGNNYWLFSGSNQGVGFADEQPETNPKVKNFPFNVPNLGASLKRNK